MPDTSLLKNFNATCGGGLVLNKDVYDMAPGEALQLVNFEPSTEGGYRRLNGTTKYNSTIVPQVVSAADRVQMSAIFNDKIIAARGGTVYYGGTTGSWTSIATSQGVNNTYDFDKFNFSGTSKIIIATGEAPAFTVDTSFNVDVINATGGGTAPTNPKFIKTFANHVFYGGMSNSTHSILFSVPFSEDNFTSASGAGEIRVGDVVTGLKVFRDELFIFCQRKIYKLTGTTSTTFALAEVAKNVGTIANHSIQEIGGDLIFLAADGLRTIAGTERIGDVELGTISKQVQERINEITYDNVTATVVRNKSQYRLFYPKDSGLETTSKGLLAVIKTNPNTGQLGFEFADIKGLRVSSCDSDYIDNVETIVHGGYDGFIYLQESGNVFTTSSATNSIDATYRSPDMAMGDAGIRKSMDRININWEPEGIVSSSLFVRYNYDDINTPQPTVISLESSGSGAYFGTGLFGTAAYGQGDLPITRESVEGSGFAVALKITDTSTNAPFAIKGFQLEFTPGGKKIMGATYTRQSSSAIVDGGVIEASDLNAEFNQLLAAFAVTSGHTHDGTTAEGGPITKLLGTAITIGDATAGTDISITLDGESNDGVLTWKEDEDYFEFSDDLLLATTEKLQFRDTAIYINSSADGQLDLVADTEIQIAATTIDINGLVDISGNLSVGGNLDVTGSFDMSDANITNIGSIALDTITNDGTDITLDSSGDIILDADGADVFLKDAGTTYGSLTNSSGNLIIKSGTTTAATFSGANVTLAGTVGSGAITSTGIVTGTGFTAGSAVLAEAELELLDGLTAGTAIASKVVTTDANIDTTGQRNLTITGELDAATLDISGDADIDGTTNLDVVDIDGAVDMASTLAVTGIATFTDDIIIGDGKTIGSASDPDAITIASNGQLTLTQTLIGTALDISGDIDVDGTSNLDAVDIDGAVDMASTLQVDGAITSSDGMTITTADNTETLVLKSTDADANVGPLLVLRRDSSSPADNDLLGEIQMEVENSNGSKLDAVTLTGKVLDVTAGTVDGSLAINVISGSTLTEFAKFEGSVGSTFSQPVSITSADNLAQLTLKSTDADANAGPLLVFHRDSSSPANNDFIGNIQFEMENDAGEQLDAVSILGKISDVADGTEDAEIQFFTRTAGSMVDRFAITRTEVSVNDGSVDSNFRVESNGNANMLFVDAGNDRVGIGTSSPSEELEVSGAQNTITKSKTTTSTALGGFEAHGSASSYIKVFQHGPSFGGTTFGGVSGNDQSLIEAQAASSVVFSTQGNAGGSNPDFIFAPQRSQKVIIKSDGSVGIGTSAPDGQLHIVGSDTTDQVIIENTDAGTSSAPDLVLFRNSASPVDGDVLGRIDFRGDNDAGESVNYMFMYATATDVSDGTEDVKLDFEGMKAGSNAKLLTIGQDEVIVNEDSNDVDFRVESNGNTHTLFAEGSSGNVGIGDTSLSGNALSIKVADTRVTSGRCLDVHHSKTDTTFSGIVARFQSARNTTDGTYEFIRCAISGVANKFIVTDGGTIQAANTTVASISDERIKQDIVDAKSQWDDIKALKFKNFKKKQAVRDDGDNALKELGVIAQDVESAGMNGLIEMANPDISSIKSDSSFGTLWTEDDEEVINGTETVGEVKEIKEQVKTVKYSMIWMKSVKALQEAMERIEKLEAKVTALETTP